MGNCYAVSIHSFIHDSLTITSKFLIAKQYIFLVNYATDYYATDLLELHE